MKLTCNQQCDSIAPFEEISDLPDFMVLTGLNGTGKTQLLKAIEADKITINDGNLNSVYFNYTDFKISSEKETNKQELQQSATNSWNLFTNKNTHPKKIHLCTLLQQQFQRSNLHLHQSEIEKLGGENTSLSKAIETLPKDSEIKKKWMVYFSSVRKLMIQQRNILKDRRIDAIYDIFQRSHKPLHLLTQDEYTSYYDPSYEGENILSSKLSAEFLRYLRLKFKFCYDKRESMLEPEAAKLFEQEYLPPWQLIDDILSSFDSFESLDFGLESLTLEQYSDAAYKYPAPAVNVKHVDTPIPFTKLSSGEQVLLSMAVTIYNSNRNYLPPDILLLDEVDATLHPSMIKTLLKTLKNVFSSAGTKVILATHSPTTVALAEEGEIVVIHKDPEKIAIEGKLSVYDKSRALNLLSEGFVTINKGDKFVITEANADSEYFQCVFDRLVRKDLLPSHPLLKFIPASKEKDSGKGGGCEQAKQWALKLRDLPGSNFICLLDADLEGQKPNEESESIKVLKRSALENYLYDPLSILAIIVDNGGSALLQTWGARDACSSEVFNCSVSELVQLVKEIEVLFSISREETTTFRYAEGKIIEVSDRWEKERGHDLASMIYSKANQTPLNKSFDSTVFTKENKKNLTLHRSKNIDFIPVSLRETFKAIQLSFFK